MRLSLSDFLGLGVDPKKLVKETIARPIELMSGGLIDSSNVMEFFNNPKEELQASFKPEFGAPEMRASQKMLADALRANPVPTTDESRRGEDYMRQARRRRGRAASVLAGRSETSTPLGSTGAPPSYGARSVLG